MRFPIQLVSFSITKNYLIMLKNILKLDGAKPLSKKVQQEIGGGIIGRPTVCQVFCPSYCYCASPPFNDYCLFSSGPRQGQFCHAL